MLYDLFKGKSLQKTLAALSSTKAMELSILPYGVEDGIYLEDWNALSDVIPPRLNKMMLIRALPNNLWQEMLQPHQHRTMNQ